MRYWIYCGDRLIGPCELDKIREIEGFDANTLVCPEEQPGAYPRQWQWRRAAQVSELSLHLLLAPSEGGTPPEAWGAMLPPEPTLDDVAAISSLQEKIRLLSHSIHLLRDQMSEQGGQIAELKSGLSEKEKALKDALLTLCDAENERTRIIELRNDLATMEKTIRAVQLKLSEAEERTRSLEALRQETAEAKAETAALEARLSELSAGKEQMENHARRLDSLQQARRRFAGRLAEAEQARSKAELRLGAHQERLDLLREEVDAVIAKTIADLRSEIVKIVESRPPEPRPAPQSAPQAAPPKKTPADSGEFGLPTLSLMDDSGLETLDIFGEETGPKGKDAP
ncbi:MAG: hypothetical protein HY922_03425 [Elusimicrobia bacterium]|nr:hypothetical protein [Elusimicrobiota bacterium]